MRNLLSAFFFWLGLCLILAASRAPAAPDAYDLYADDATSATTNRLMLNTSQIHVIDGPQDEDWATFYAEEGLPYSIQVTQVGSGLDPELWVYPNGQSRPELPFDFHGYGEGEVFGLTRWPATGTSWVRVRANRLQEGPTTYTLVVYRETSANLGLATISKSRESVPLSGSASAQPTAGEGMLKLPARVNLADGSTTEPLYSESYLAYAAGTFNEEALPDYLQIAGPGESIDDLGRPWMTKWHELFPTNFTITGVAAMPAVPLAQPIQLALELHSGEFTADLTDGGEGYWPEVTFRDLPPSATVEGTEVEVYLWKWKPGADSLEGDWEIYDAHPRVEQLAQCWLAITSFETFPSDGPWGMQFFAAAARAKTTEVSDPSWAAYP